MKRTTLLVGIIASLAFVQVAQAGPITFGDSTIHWAGYDQSPDPSSFNNTDFIGSPQYVGGVADIDLSGPLASLKSISFIDDPTAHALLAYNKFLAVGDLFVDVNADSTWDYVVKSFGKSFAASTATLYNVTGLGISTNVSDAGKYVNGYVRTNQPVALASVVNAVNLGAVNYSGYYDMGSNSYSVKYDFGALALNLNNNDFIVSFSSACGNDVVEEQVPVPEPGTMVLLGLGMLGVAVYGKRRMNKEA